MAVRYRKIKELNPGDEILYMAGDTLALAVVVGKSSKSSESIVIEPVEIYQGQVGEEPVVAKYNEIFVRFDDSQIDNLNDLVGRQFLHMAEAYENGLVIDKVTVDHLTDGKIWPISLRALLVLYKRDKWYLFKEGDISLSRPEDLFLKVVS